MQNFFQFCKKIHIDLKRRQSYVTTGNKFDRDIITIKRDVISSFCFLADFERFGSKVTVAYSTNQ